MYIKNKEIFEVYKKDFSKFKNQHNLPDCISKLVNNTNNHTFNHISGYFLNKQLNDEYYKEYTVYKKNESITFSKSNMNIIYTSDGLCLGKLRELISDNNVRESLYGYFLDKQLNDNYYKEHTVYKKHEIINFSRSDMYSRYTLDKLCLGKLRGIIDGSEKCLHGYFLDKTLNEDYYKEYQAYKKNESITFSKNDMNNRYTPDGINMGTFINLINKICNSVNGWFLDKAKHDEYYSIITLYYNNYIIISYKGEVTQNLKNYNLTKVYINELLAGKFIHMKEVYLNETLHNINYCKKYKILIEDIPVKCIHNYI